MLLEEKNLCLSGFGSFNEQHEKTFQARKRVISRGKRSLLLPKNHAALQAALPSRIKCMRLPTLLMKCIQCNCLVLLSHYLPAVCSICVLSQ